MIELFETTFLILAFFSGSYMLLVGVTYIALFLVSLRKVSRERGLNELLYHKDLSVDNRTFPVSVLVPSYNEEIGITSTVRSLIALNYPEYEIIIIDDGSKDTTAKQVIDTYQMKQIGLETRKHIETEEVFGIYQSSTFEKIKLLRKENGGKSDALNAGINVSKYPYFCAMDADCILEPDALLKTMKPILESNGDVVVTGGSIRIANGCEISHSKIERIGLPKQPLVMMQIVEYLRAFLIGRLGLSRLNILLIISGAFGVFNKELVIRTGGYRVETVGEDMELIVRIHRLLKEEKSKRRITYVPDPVCWTEAPGSLRSLFNQRVRWQRGLTETLLFHKKMILNPRYRSVGLLSLPYFLFVELLGGIFEAVSLIVIAGGLFLGLVDIKIVLIMLCISIAYGSLLSSLAILLEESTFQKYPKRRHVVKLYLYALTETFWYRPILIFARLKGIFLVFTKTRKWGDMERKGISEE